jgi:hypothetical protein
MARTQLISDIAFIHRLDGACAMRGTAVTPAATPGRKMRQSPVTGSFLAGAQLLNFAPLLPVSREARESGIDVVDGALSRQRAPIG